MKTLVLNVQVEVAIDDSEVSKVQDMEWIAKVVKDNVKDDNYKIIDVSMCKPSE